MLIDIYFGTYVRALMAFSPFFRLLVRANTFSPKHMYQSVYAPFWYQRKTEDMS